MKKKKKKKRKKKKKKKKNPEEPDYLTPQTTQTQKIMGKEEITIITVIIAAPLKKKFSTF